MYPVIWKMKAQVSTVAAIGSVLSNDRCRTGMASAFHTSACRRASLEGDSKMILSAAASISAEYRPSKDWFLELISAGDDFTFLAAFIEAVFLVVPEAQPHNTSVSASSTHNNRR